MAVYVDVNPELLQWAVDRAGLPLERYGDNLDAWLKAKRKPTQRQLEDFARRAMVPLGYLFLDEPPVEQLPAPDYRTRSDQEVQRPSPNLIETIFEMKRRQEWMCDYLLDAGHKQLGFVASAKIDDEIAPLASRMRATLHLNTDWAAEQSSWEDAHRFLRRRIEDAGILIFANGIVGNNTSRKLDPEEFQGFVLVDDVAPLIFVNASDYKSAQMFTMAHELAHVWTGNSALFELDATRPTDNAVEVYCNAVAAEFLVPKERLVDAWPQVATNRVIMQLAARFKVSPIVLARRAKDCSFLTQDAFFAFYREYTAGERAKQSDQEGGDFYKNAVVRLGRRFGLAVAEAARSGRLSFVEAYNLTTMHGRTFDEFIHQLQQGSSE